MTEVIDYHARARALRAKFYPDQPPVVQIARPQPRIVEVIRSSYDQVRKAGVVMKRGKHGPFPLDPIFQAHAAFDAANAKIETPRSPKAIIAGVAKKHAIGIDVILSPRRDLRAVNARHEAIAAVYVRCPHLSLPQIATLFRRDHTTCLYAVQKLGVWRGASS